jgi:hypothetical protein
MLPWTSRLCKLVQASQFTHPGLPPLHCIPKPGIMHVVWLVHCAKVGQVPGDDEGRGTRVTSRGNAAIMPCLRSAFAGRPLISQSAISRACRTIFLLGLRLRCIRAVLLRGELFTLLATHIGMTKVFFGLDMISDPLLQYLGLWEASFGFPIPKQYCLHLGCSLLCHICLLTCAVRAFREWRKGQCDVENATRRRHKGNFTDGRSECTEELLSEL